MSAGACLGALLFGWLTDRFGRRRIFMVTLALYLTATILTGVSFSIWWFYGMRFLTGAGIGGEYAAINSAIDELIPARVRGTIDLIINGSFWVGTVIAGALALLLLNQSLFGTAVGWRLGFGLGALLGLGILFIRRQVPESPRWLVIHGHDREADRIVSGIEHDVLKAMPEDQLPDYDQEATITIEQRRSIGLGEMAGHHVPPLPAALGREPDAVRRPGVSVQRGRLRAGRSARCLLQGAGRPRADLHHPVRGRQLPGAAAAGTPVRLGRGAA